MNDSHRPADPSIPLISVVIPAYRTAACIGPLGDALRTRLETITPRFEIVWVDDGSPDDAWKRIQEAAAHDPRVRGIRLARNFGQHTAITAGIDACRGEWAVVMDGDFQDRPEEIPRLWAKAREGFDIVFARRMKRHDPWLTRVTSRLFHRCFRRLSGIRHDPAVANFGIYSRRTLDAYRAMRERHRVFPLLVQWLGLPTAWVDVQHGDRRDGRSSYSFLRRLNLALDAVISMSDKPLKLAMATGAIVMTGAALFLLVQFSRRLIAGVPLSPGESLVAAIFLASGMVMFTVGTMGIYTARVLDEVRNRPLYLVAEHANPEPAPERRDSVNGHG